MDIQIKNLKHSEFASQETHCFQATLYVDGKPLCEVYNEGHGGCDGYRKISRGPDNYREKIREIEDELSKEKITTQWGEMDNSLEIVVGELVNDTLTRREIQKVLRKKIAFVDNECEKGQYVTMKKLKPTPENIERVKKSDWWEKDNIILNELPIDEAVKYL